MSYRGPAREAAAAAWVAHALRGDFASARLVEAGVDALGVFKVMSGLVPDLVVDPDRFADQAAELAATLRMEDPS